MWMFFCSRTSQFNSYYFQSDLIFSLVVPLFVFSSPHFPLSLVSPHDIPVYSSPNWPNAVRKRKWTAYKSMSASPLATLQSSCSLSNHSLSFIYPSLLSHSLDLPIHSRMIKLILLLVLLAIAVSYVEAQWGCKWFSDYRSDALPYSTVTIWFRGRAWLLRWIRWMGRRIRWMETTVVEKKMGRRTVGIRWIRWMVIDLLSTTGFLLHLRHIFTVHSA